MRRKRTVDFSNAFPFRIDGDYCRLLPLSRGLYAIVDASEYAELSRYAWHATPTRQGRDFYAHRKEVCLGRRRTIPLHRHLLGLHPGDGLVGDHRNGNTLDCRRSNLRVSTPVGNARNRRMHSSNTSGFPGVRWRKERSCWIAQIRDAGKKIHLGSFATREEAAAQYNRAMKERFGELARSA